MKLPSLQQVFGEAARTFRRFPLVLADAVVWTIAALILADYEGPPSSSILFPILFATALGFPLLLVLALIAERKPWSKTTALGVQAAGVLLLIAYALIVPGNLPYAPEFHVQRLLTLGFALCALLAAAPMGAAKQLNDYWHYDKLLLQRVVLAGVFSATLYGGLSIAVASIDFLFGVEIPGKRYGELGLLILGLFSTWFFLADVPAEVSGLEPKSSYPRALKVFGQYILSPMLIVYFVILYAYVAKITIEWSWPKGLVGGTIFGFAAIGIAAYLLLYPIRDRAEYKWVTTSARWFWIAMIPMTVVLELAIWRRVSEYGITENRYIASGLGVWLAVMAIYFLVSRAKNLKAIPTSLCVLALLAAFGPWSMFSVSASSQVGRLEELLTRNQLLVGGTAQRSSGDIPIDDEVQISSIIRYLYRTHGYDAIQPWFSESLTQDSAGIGSIAVMPDSVTTLLGVEYARVPRLGRDGIRMLRTNMQDAVDIEGYDLMIASRFHSDAPEFAGSDGGFICRVDTNLDVLTARIADSGMIVDSVQVKLRPFVDSLLRDHGRGFEDSLAPEMMSIQTRTETMGLKVVLRQIEYRTDSSGITPVAYDAMILYSRQPEQPPGP